VSLDRLAAACLLPSFPGLEAPDWVLRWVERGLGGVCLFAYNVGDREQLRRLCDSLAARAELVVAVDEEGGDVTRLEWEHGSSYPGNLALGAVDDAELTGAVAGAIACGLRACGVTMNLAPVADANTNPANPVIGVRSFGSDPALVARHSAAFVRGTQDAGVRACAKHFPGHGDTTVDSHRALPVVSGDLEPALLPFRAAVEAGVDALMTGHLVVPALDDAPATLSRAVVADLLRGELGFRGLVVSDALEMGAIAGTVGVEEAAIRALDAGVDLLCLGHDLHEAAVESVHTAILGAVRSGRLAASRVEEAAGRVAAARPSRSPVTAPGPSPAVGLDAARRALAGDGQVRVGAVPFVVELVPEANVAAGEARHGLAAVLGAPGVRLDGPDAVAPPPGRPLVVVVRDAARHPWQRDLVARLVAARPDAVIVETGLPGDPPPGAAGYLVTRGAGRVNLQAAAGLLLA
jgi:beta-N-acetylhexosaminidase